MAGMSMVLIGVIFVIGSWTTIPCYGDPPCDPIICVLPECYCPDGGLEEAEVPPVTVQLSNNAEPKNKDCVRNAVVKYNECHKDATAFFDLHSGRMTTQEDGTDMEHTQTCMIEAFKILCISIEAHKCSESEANKILDTVKNFAVLRFLHCSEREIVGLSSRIMKYAEKNNITLITDVGQNSDVNRYDVV